MSRHCNWIIVTCLCRISIRPFQLQPRPWVSVKSRSQKSTSSPLSLLGQLISRQCLTSRAIERNPACSGRSRSIQSTLILLWRQAKLHRRLRPIESRARLLQLPPQLPSSWNRTRRLDRCRGVQSCNEPCPKTNRKSWLKRTINCHSQCQTSDAISTKPSIWIGWPPSVTRHCAARLFPLPKRSERLTFARSPKTWTISASKR